MNDTIIQILAIVIFVATASISIYHRRKADQKGGEMISLKEKSLGFFHHSMVSWS